MTMTSSKLACAASGQCFEEWLRRPVYIAHCFTSKLARELCGIQLKSGEGMASVHSPTGAYGLSTFRALKPFRSREGNELRGRVAARVRSMRREGIA